MFQHSIAPDRVVPAVAILARNAHALHAAGGVGIQPNNQGKDEAEGGEQQVQDHGGDGLRMES